MHRPRSARTRHGFSPLELLVVVVVATLALGIVTPIARSALDTAAVAGAARRIASAHLRTRVTAVMESRIALLTVTADSLVVRVVVGTDTVTRWASRGPGADGVSVAGPTRAFRFNQIGLMSGVTNGTWRLSRGQAQRNVVVSRLGRLRVVRP